MNKLSINNSFNVYETNNVRFIEIQNLSDKFIKINSMQLVYLDMTNNSLQEWPKQFELPNLVHLNLKKNQLDNLNSLTTKKFNILQYLDLSYNPITKIAINTSLMELVYLDLSFTKISHLSYHDFQYFVKLKIFKLVNCLIKSMDENLMSNFITLHELYLNKTKLPVGKEYFMVDQQKYLKVLHSQYFSLCCFVLSITKTIKHCSPTRTTFSSCSNLLVNNFVQSIFWIFGICGFFGNILSIYFRLKSFHRPSHIFYLLLSVSDILTSNYLLIIVTTDHFYKGNFFGILVLWTRSYLCKFSGFLMNFSLLYSMTNLFLISLDRYLAIFYSSICKFTKEKVIIMCLISFFICMFLAIFPILFYDVSTRKNNNLKNK